jgi:TolB-like protein/Tfp pilus assembly protein PilF
MPTGSSASSIVRFGEYEADLAAGHLRRRGARVRLRAQAFDVLALLLERAGRVVTREELRHRLWRDDVFVDFDNSLNTAVARLREALHDSPEHPRYIETLPKHGYRFIAGVAEAVQATEPITEKVRVVVLPLANLSGAAEEYFSDAMTDEITTELARIAPAELAVIARTTAMRYKATQKDVARIGRELAVDYVVEGSVRCLDGRIALNVQLVHATRQTHVWARRYDAELGEIFSVRHEIAREIAARTVITSAFQEPVALPAPAERVVRAPTADPAAYNDYIQGRFLMNRMTAGSLAKAREHLERAIQRDPEFALAYDALAEIWWYIGYFGFAPPREAFSTGVLFAVRALEIDSNLAETHALLGQYHKQLTFNWPEVEREMALALTLDPSSPVVRVRYAGNLLMPLGRLQEAVQELERALELDPLSTVTHTWLAVMLLLSRQYDRARHEAMRLLELEPMSYWGYLILGGTYREQQSFEPAIEIQRKAVEVSGSSPAMLGWLGLALAQSGNAAEARDLLQRLQRMAATAYVPPTAFAWIHLGLGDVDSAFEWLDRAIDARDQLMMPIKSYPIFDPIRSDPRFAGLLRKMNLDS